MRMHNPPHPGEIIRKLCLEPPDLTVKDAAAAATVAGHSVPPTRLASAVQAPRADLATRHADLGRLHSRFGR